MLTSISGRLKQAFDGHGHTMHVVTERSGERIDEMVETLFGKQIIFPSHSARCSTVRPSSAAHGFDTGSGR